MRTSSTQALTVRYQLQKVKNCDTIQETLKESETPAAQCLIIKLIIWIFKRVFQMEHPLQLIRWRCGYIQTHEDRGYKDDFRGYQKN